MSYLGLPEELTKDVAPESLIDYLEAVGWNADTNEPTSEILSFHKPQTSVHVRFPANTHLVDYILRITEAIVKIAKAEGQSAVDLLLKLLQWNPTSITERDVVKREMYLTWLKKGTETWTSEIETMENQGDKSLVNIELVGVDLTNAKLSRANLKNVNLSNADLSGADLSYCELTGTDLSSANLRGTNLQEAKLERASLNGATLDSALFADADLTDADLSDATGLLPDQLAGSILIRAQLPASVETFEGIKVTEEMSKNASKYFLALLVGCLFAFLTITSTKDVSYFTDTSSSTLPLIQTSVSTRGFFYISPLLLLGAFIYLHLELLRLWEAVAKLPAVFPDGISLNRKVYPWILNSFIYHYIDRLRTRKVDMPALLDFQTSISFFLLSWTTPILMTLFWVRYLRFRDLPVTCFHLLLIGVSLFAGRYLHRNSVNKLSRHNPLDEPETGWKRIHKNAKGLYFVLGMIALIIFSFGAIYGVIPYQDKAISPTDKVESFETTSSLFEPTPYDHERVIISAPDRSLRSYDPRKWTPWLLAQVNFLPFADLSDADISFRPAGWTDKNDPTYNLVRGARLKDSDLRYVRAYNAFLVKADCQRANFTGSILNNADLRRADFRDADLEATLDKADLSGADLTRTHLEAVNLSTVVLTGTIFQDTFLHGATLAGANLKEIKLIGVDLSSAHLNKINLSHSYLFNTKLTNAEIENADLEGAVLIRVDLTGADIHGTHLEGAKLNGLTKITQAQLDSAVTDIHTQVDPPLVVHVTKSSVP